MPITLKQSQLKYKNPETGTYVGVDAVAEKTTAEMVAEVESAGQAKISAINARATEVQASLPKVEEMEDIIAVPFVQSEPYPEGAYVIQTVDNVNQLYKLPEGHTAGVAWGEFTVIGPITFSEELNYTIKDLVAVQDEQPESSDNKIWMTETPPEPVVVPTYDEFEEIAERAGLSYDFMRDNDFDYSAGKENVLEVPYVLSNILTGSLIYADGSINNTGAAYDVSPLIPISEGTYGLKTSHNAYIGMINEGNNFKNGYGFFGADGHTIVTRPENLLHEVSTDIYVFDVPSNAKYVCFTYKSADGYRDDALAYFNQWILLPNANDDIDESFFILRSPKEDGETEKIFRMDGTKIYLRDDRIGDLSELNTLHKTDIVSAINEGIGGGGNDAWLEANNLDATANGKVNVLSTPYILSDIAAGKIIYSNGSLNDNANADVSPLIPVSEGTYGLKIAHSEHAGVINSGNNYKNGYGFFGQDGETIVARPTNLMHQVATDIYVFDVPSTAKYVRFCYSSGEGYSDTALAYFNQWILLPNANDNIDGSFFTLSPKKQNGEINKIMRVDGSYVAVADAESRSRIDTLEALPITFGRRTCAIFEKVCCIGDSYTEGYIVDSSDVSHTNKAYSWVEHLKNMTGRDYVNLGIGGATSASWLTSERGLAKAQLPENKSQAYIIGLQINDAAQGLTVGTTADIGTNTQSYYGCTSKIIDEMFEINDYAHVFLLTQPKNYTGEHSPYRTAILNIVDWYQNANNGTHQNQVHLIDLLDYWQLFRNAGCVDAMYGGHYTPVGYEYVAEIMMYAWSNYINAHPLLFQDVNLIPFGADS